GPKLASDFHAPANGGLLFTVGSCASRLRTPSAAPTIASSATTMTTAAAARTGGTGAAPTSGAVKVERGGRGLTGRRRAPPTGQRTRRSGGPEPAAGPGRGAFAQERPGCCRSRDPPCADVAVAIGSLCKNRTLVYWADRARRDSPGCPRERPPASFAHAFSGQPGSTRGAGHEAGRVRRPGPQRTQPSEEPP